MKKRIIVFVRYCRRDVDEYFGKGNVCEKVVFVLDDLIEPEKEKILCVFV